MGPLARTRKLISRQIFRTFEDFRDKSLISANKATSHSEADLAFFENRPRNEKQTCEN